LNRVYYAQACFQELSMNESALWSLLASIEHTQSEKETDTGYRKPENIKKGIYLDALHFSFGKKVVLKNASMNIPAGQIVAIVGQRATFVAAGFSLRQHRLESLCHPLTANWY